jgi:catechol 2,3-dioxygenase-like lactoylglutathione lyase family enzyme
MLDHVAIPVSDLDTSCQFYGKVLEPLGAQVVMEFPGVTLFGTGDGMVAIRESAQIAPVHVAFKADRAGVQAFYDAAMAAGASDNGAPGIRSDYHENYFAAYVKDPDGHNIEAVSHTPE